MQRKAGAARLPLFFVTKRSIFYQRPALTPHFASRVPTLSQRERGTARLVI
jgi:hypothetical protein